MQFPPTASAKPTSAPAFSSRHGWLAGCANRTQQQDDSTATMLANFFAQIGIKAWLCEWPWSLRVILGGQLLQVWPEMGLSAAAVENRGHAHSLTKATPGAQVNEAIGEWGWVIQVRVCFCKITPYIWAVKLHYAGKPFWVFTHLAEWRLSNACCFLK